MIRTKKVSPAPVRGAEVIVPAKSGRGSVSSMFASIAATDVLPVSSLPVAPVKKEDSAPFVPPVVTHRAASTSKLSSIQEEIRRRDAIAPHISANSLGDLDDTIVADNIFDLIKQHKNLSPPPSANTEIVVRSKSPSPDLKLNLFSQAVAEGIFCNQFLFLS